MDNHVVVGSVWGVFARVVCITVGCGGDVGLFMSCGLNTEEPSKWAVPGVVGCRSVDLSGVAIL